MSAADARKEFFKTLADTGFAPPESAVAEFGAATKLHLPLSASGREDAAAAIRSDVEAFAADFWHLTPAERLKSWNALAARCLDGPARVFLSDLYRGVDVEVREQVDGEAAELADVIRELFVLRRGPRAVRREEWLASRGRDRDWRPGMKNLMDADPETAELDGPLLKVLTTRNAGLKPITKADEWHFRQVAGNGRGDDAAPAPARRGRDTDTDSYRSSSSSDGSGWRNWLIGVVVIGALLRGCGAIMKNSGPSSTPSNPSNTFDLQKFTESQKQRPAFTFTEDEVTLFKLYVPKLGNKEPARYSMWVISGRPEANAKKATR